MMTTYESLNLMIAFAGLIVAVIIATFTALAVLQKKIRRLNKRLQANGVLFFVKNI